MLTTPAKSFGTSSHPNCVRWKLESLESKLDENERRAERRHDEVMAAVRQVQDDSTLLQRVARLESKDTHTQ